MKAKKQTKQTRIELDAEVVADLEPSEDDTTTIKGGVKTVGCSATLSPS